MTLSLHAEVQEMQVQLRLRERFWESPETAGFRAIWVALGA
jgi:hypothetical protein